MSPTPIRVGIIGVGWGSLVQVPAFQMVPAFEVVALCSRQGDRVAAAGERLGITDVSTDWKALVARDDLDLISVCTPVDLHHEQVLAALANGKDVLVEKPLALDSGQTAEMLAAAEAAGSRHAVCFEGRWEPTRLRIWETVASGSLGVPYLARGSATADFWHPSRGTQSEWMYRKDQGGGYLMGMASHDIDFVCALFGEPAAVCADVRTTVTERRRDDGTTLEVDADDTSALVLRMANGMLVTIMATAVALGRSDRSFDAFGSTGSVHFRGPLLGEGTVELRAGTVGQDAMIDLPLHHRMPASGAALPPRRSASAIRALALMLEDWLPAFHGEPTSVPTLVDGHRVQRVIEAAIRSSAGEGWVSLET
ncbi:MAG TPA: Gfo/Idh/MocA family oxidoreductase [Acidimicrobiales bacterium]|jgi:predicted dehydrogenase